MNQGKCDAHPGVFNASEVSRLGKLAASSEFTSPIERHGWDLDLLRSKLQTMIHSRVVEEEIGERVADGRIKCPCHLMIGQEAIAPGISEFLESSDRVFGGHRSHSHYLALGGELDGLTAEVYGKSTGCSRGMGGSMHLLARDKGFMGSVPIVAGTIPIAVGAALAAKMDGSSAIAVTYFGDGAAEEGGFHESLNLAACHTLPVLFVCENNLYSSHLDIDLRQPTDSVSRFGLAHQMPSLVVDGNDITAMLTASEYLIHSIRNGKGPALLEAITFRHRGHVGPDENIDVGVRRSEVDLKKWKKRDPIYRLSEGLQKESSLKVGELDSFFEQSRDEVRASFTRAETADYPPKNALLDWVFAS